MPEGAKQEGKVSEASQGSPAPALGDPKLSAGEHDLLAGLCQPSSYVTAQGLHHP